MFDGFKKWYLQFSVNSICWYKMTLFWRIIFYFLLFLSPIIVTLLEVIIKKSLIVGLGIIRSSPVQSNDPGALTQDLTFVD